MNIQEAWRRLSNRDLSLPLTLAEIAAEWMLERSNRYRPYQAIDWHPIYETDMPSNARRLAREKSLPFEWTPYYRKWLAEQFDHKCAYCGRARTKFHIDHIIPVSWKTCPGATVDNGVWSCATCNMDRGNKDLATWHLDTFKDPERTDELIRTVWAVQGRALKHFDVEERSKMRALGKKILRQREKRLKR